MAIDRDRALAIQRTALADFARAMSAASEDARLFERDGVAASGVPACPERSIPNSVAYRDTDALLSSLDELASFYEDAGVRAWTVWVPEFDREAAAGLEAAGSAYDGNPTAMVLDLTGFEPPDIGDLEWDADGDAATLGDVNDRAYGHGPGEGYAPGMTQRPEGFRIYRARVDGQVACVMGTMEHEGGDLGIYWVATVPEFRGRSLSKRLMTAALVDARERGFATSSLQASSMGEPVYLRLGYEACFDLHLYERRAGAVT